MNRASLNHVFNVVWNTARRCWTAVCEFARRSHGGSASASILRPLLASSTFVAVLGHAEPALAAPPPLHVPAVDVGALPEGGVIAQGDAAIAVNGNAMTVDQNSDRAVINWQSFNIGRAASVHFEQNSADAVALNRVLGSDVSQIYGQLSATGQVFLLNSNGVVFGESAQIDVGGLAASTMSLSDADFMAGNYHFEGDSDAAIYNAGSLNADAGYVALLANRIENEGLISARLGSVVLAAGETVTLDIQGSELLSVAVEAGSMRQLIANNSLIDAGGGQVIMTATAAQDLLQSAVATDQASADSMVMNADGSISLIQAGGDVLADSVAIDAGSNGRVVLSGGISVANNIGSGGDIAVSGDQVIVDSSAVLDASGRDGGGQIHVGGGYQGGDPTLRNAQITAVEAGAVLSADAVVYGDGGEVVVWSDGHTAYQGSISARGGDAGGDGGRVEVSGREILDFAGTVDAGAELGEAGSLLLDPKNIRVSSDTQTDGLTANTLAYSTNATGDSVINPDTITAVTNTGVAVTLQANTDITIETSIISTNGSGDGGTLNFEAGRSISVQGTIFSDNGDVNFIINDDAVSSNRDAGAAEFTNYALINAGTGTVTITADNAAANELINISTGSIQAGALTITDAEVDVGGTFTLGSVSLTGNLTIDASTATVDIVNTTSDGTLRVQGLTALTTAGDVDIQGGSTDLEQLAVIANNVTVYDKKALELGGSAFASVISGDLHLDIVGPVGNAGAVTVVGDAMIKTTDGGFGIAASDIDLANYGNDFSTLIIDQDASASTATINDINNLVLAGTFNSSLSVTTGGNLEDLTQGQADAYVDPLFSSGATLDVSTVAPITATYVTLNSGASGNITLDHASTDFDYLTVTNANAVVLSDVDNMYLRNITTQGSFTLDAGNNIELDSNYTANTGGDFSLHNTSGNIFFDNYSDIIATGNATFTSDAGSVTSGYGAATLTVTGGDLTITAASVIGFGDDYLIDVNTSGSGGDLFFTAGGDIYQHGTFYSTTSDSGKITVDGAAKFTVTAADSDLLIYEDGNTFAGTVTMASSFPGSYQDVKFRNANAANAVLAGLESAGTLRNVQLYFDAAPSVELPGMTITQNLTVDTPQGALTQSGALNVTGDTFITVSSAKDVTFSNASNDFNDIVFESANNVTLVDVDDFNFYVYSQNSSWYYNRILGDLDVTAGGNVTQTNNPFGLRVSGAATFTLGSNSLTLLNGNYNQFNDFGIVSAASASVYTTTSMNLLDINVTGTFDLQSYSSSANLTQETGTTVTTGGNTRFYRFDNITLTNTGNVMGDLIIDDDNLSTYAGTTRITENDAITQYGAWETYYDTVILTTENDQAITLTTSTNQFGALTITQQNSGAASAGAVSITENQHMTQSGAWTTHGDTALITSGSYDITLNNSGNVLADLQITTDQLTLTENDTITDYAAWTTTNVTALNAYAAGVSGQGDITLDHTGNSLGDLTLTAQNIHIIENHNITDYGAWTVPGNVILNPTVSNVYLDNGGNALGGIDLDGSPGSVLITENHDITQSGAWAIGAAPVTLNSSGNDIIVTESGNVMGYIVITVSSGLPASVSITEDSTITQGSAWEIPGVAVNLIAENDNAITLTNSANSLGDLTVTGGAVSITEDESMSDGGAWTTTGTTTLNVGSSGTTSIVLNNTANVLGGLAFGGTPSSISITENDDLTQASAWSLADVPIVLLVQDNNDIVLNQAANILGNLDLTAGGSGNLTLVEADPITDSGNWTIGGIAALTADASGTAQDIVIDAAGPAGSFGTLYIVKAADVSVNADMDAVQVDAAANVSLVDPNAIDFLSTAVSSLLEVDADGLISQTGAITAASFRLVGGGYATLNNNSNDVDTFAAAFSGGDLSFTDADSFTVGTVSGTVGIGIGSHNISLTSVSGTISGLTDISQSSASLTLNTGDALTLPNMVINGAQDYTAGATGITLTSTMQSTAAGVMAFHSPVTLTTDISIQSTDSAISFDSTVDGGGNILTVNAGTSTITFSDAVSNMGSTGDAQAALNLSANAGSLFTSTLAANNGITATGPITFQDDVTLANGNVGSTFAGLVTLGKVGGMNLSGYDTLRFTKGVLLADGPATIDSNDSQLTFEDVEVTGPYNLTLDSGTAQIVGLNLVGTDLTSLDVTAQYLTIPGAGLQIDGPMNFTATDNTNIRIDGDLTSTSAGSITFNSPVLLEQSVTATTVNSDLHFVGTLNGAHDLSANTGSGTVSFDGAIGDTAPLGDGTGAALNLIAANAVFASTLETNSGITLSGQSSFAGNVTLDDGDTGSTFGGQVSAGGITINGYDGLAFNGGIALTDDLNLIANGSAITFGASVGGAYALNANALAGGAGTFSGLNNIASNLTSLTLNAQTLSLPDGLAISGPMDFSAPGGITLNGAIGSAAAPATGTVSFHNAVTLGADTSVTSANALISFDDIIDGAWALILDAGTSGVQLDAALGGSTPLTSLSATGASIALNGGAITTTGTQTFNGASSLGAATTLDASGVTFNGTLNGGYALDLAGNVSFGGVVGGSTPLLSIDSAGATSFNTSAVTTNDYQSYAAAITLVQDVALTGEGITLSSTVDGGQALVIDAGNSTAVLGGTVGGVTPLSSLNVTSDAALALPEVTTTGAQVYTPNGSISVSGNLTGVGITLNDVVQITSDALELDAGTGTLHFDDLINAGSYDLTLTADEIDLTSALVGTGNLWLRPSSAAMDMSVGGSDGAALDITAVEEAFLPSTLASLSYGRNDGTGSLSLAALDYGATPLTLNGAGGISQTGALLASGNVHLYSNAGIDLSNTGNQLGALSFSGTPTSVAITDTTDITQSAAWSLSGASVTLDAGSNNITLTNGSNAFASLDLSGADADIVEADSTSITAAALSNLNLQSAGAISGAAMVVSGLTDLLSAIDGGADIIVSGSLGTVNAQSRNTANDADESGLISLTLSDGTTLGTLSTGGDIYLSSALSQSVIQDALSTLSAAGLLLGGSGSYDLSLGTNSFATLAGSAAGVNLSESNGFAIGTLNGVNGLSSSGDLFINTSGPVTQSQALSAVNLKLNGGGSYTLNNSGNAVTSLAVDGTALNFRDDSGFAIANVDGLTGITVTGNATLRSDTGVTQSEALATSGLELLGNGDFVLTHADNAIDTLAANVNDLRVRDDDGFDIGSVNTAGVSTVADFVVTSAANITQSQAITADGLGLQGAGASYTLTNAGNSFNTLAIDADSAEIVAAGAVNIGAVNPTGVTTTGDFSLIAGSTITQSEAMVIGGNTTLETTHAAGDVSVTNLLPSVTTLGQTSIGGDYTLTATSKNVVQDLASALQVAGNLNVDAASLTLGGAGNLIGGTTTTPSVAELRASGIITLGNITEAGNYSVISEATSISFDGPAVHGAAITLDNTANQFGGQLAITTSGPTVSTGADVQTGINQQVGTTIAINGTATFIAETSTVPGSGVIDLSNVGNDFGSLVLSGVSANVVENSATALSRVELSGDFNLTSAGAITQSAAVAAATFTAVSADVITLDNALNAVNAIDFGSGGDIVYSDSDGFDVVAVDAGGFDLSLTAGGSGDITQSGAFTSVNILSGGAGGSATFDSGTNDIATLGAFSTGTGLTVEDASGGLLIDGDLLATDGSVVVHTEGGNLSLAESRTITTAGTGNVILAAGLNYNFINLNTSLTSPITVNSGRMLIYSDNNALTTVGAIGGASYMGYTYAGNPPGGIAGTDDRFLFADQATLIFTANDLLRVYGDTNPTLTYGVSGYLPGDSAGDSFSGDPALSTTATVASNVGSYTVSISTGTLSSAKGYLFNFVNGTLDVDPRPIDISGSRVYDGSTAVDATIFSLDNLVGTETLGLAGSGSVASANVGSGLTVSAGSLALTSGTGLASNYTLVGGTLSADITPYVVDLSGTRSYDGTTVADATDLTLGTLVGTETLALSGSGSVASPNVGSNLTVSLGTLALADDSGSASNYTLVGGTDQLTITTAPVSISSSDVSKVYDGGTSAAGSPVVASGTLFGSDSISGGSFAFTDANVGTGLSVTASGVTVNDGNGGANYSVSYVNNTSSIITPFIISLSGARSYDGTTSVDAVDLSLGSLVGAETLNLSGSGSIADRHVGNGKTLALGDLALADGTGLASNYSFTGGTHQVDISAALISVSSSDVQKVYDGGTTAAGTATLVGGTLFGSDSLSGGSFAYTSANVGTGLTVNASGVTVSDGNGGADYSISYVANTNSEITPYVVDLYGARTYDGSNVISAADIGFVSLVGTETLSLSGAGTLVDKQVGTGKTITLDSLALGNGTGLASNYTLTGGSHLADISQRVLTISATGVNRVYDATTDATVNLGDNRVSGDVLSLSYSAAAFDTKHVGTAKNISVTGISVSGTDAANYSYSATGNASADITARTLLIDATGNNRVYDGSNTATVNLSDDRISGDLFTLNYAAALFDDENVGTAKNISVSGIAASGTDAGNYSYVTTATASADVTPAAIVVSGITADNKTYDGTADATLNYASLVFSGLVSGDDLSIDASGSFADKNVGNGKTVTLVSSYAGSDLGNYTITDQTTTSADIAARALTVSATGIDREYDGSMDATVNLSDDRVSGDLLDINYTAAAFGDKHVGTGKAVSVSGITVGGSDATNYSFNGTAVSTASITPRGLTISGISAAGRVYNADVNASVSTAGAVYTGLVTGDNVAVSASGQFIDKHAGSAKAVSLTSVYSGSDVYNYTIVDQEYAYADITPADLTVSGVYAVDKVYDGTTAVEVNSDFAVLAGTLAGDDVGLDSLSGQFVDRVVGQDKDLVGIHFALLGADAQNYNLLQPPNLRASITPRLLNISATGTSRVYDGTTTAELTLSDDRITGDVLSFSYDADFLNKNVGVGKFITGSVAISGADAANYAISGTVSAYGDISARVLDVSGLMGIDRIYDGTTDAGIDTSGAVFSGLVAGDQVTVSATGTFADKHVGSDKAVTIVAQYAGTDYQNYSITSQTDTTASISARALSVSGILAGNKVYDGTTSAALDTSAAVFSGLVGSDQLGLSVAGSFADKHAGADKVVNLVSSYSGADRSNYVITDQVTATATITARALTVSGVTASDKVYDGTNEAVVQTAGAVFSGLISGDDLGLSATGVYDDKHVGAGKRVTLSSSFSGTDLANYAITEQTQTLAAITPKTLSVSGITVDDKVYDGSVTGVANLANVALTGLIGGDEVTLSTDAVFDNKNVGTAKQVTLASGYAGADYLNYSITSQTEATASISARALGVSGIVAGDKVYDGTTSTTLDTTGVVFNGLVGNDQLGLSVSGSFADKHAGTDKTVNLVSSYNGADRNNYVITDQATTTATITPRTLIVSGVSASDKVYDGTDVAVVQTNSAVFSGLVSGDDLALSATGAYDDKHVGSGKRVTLSSSFSGTDLANYSIAEQTQTFAAITPKALSVSGITVDDKVYDGSVTGVANLANVALTGLIGGDEVTLSTDAVFDNKNVGTAKQVTLASRYAGSDYLNYSITSQTEATASISARALGVSGIVAGDKVYDGTTSTTLDTTGVVFSGLVGNDQLGLSVSGSFADKHAGTDKAVNLVSSYNGADRNNYVITDQATTTATITPRTLIVSGVSASDKVYDGTTVAIIQADNAVFSGLISGDELILSASGSYADKQVGNGKRVNLDSAFSGADLANYAITEQAQTFAAITPKALSVSGITVDDKVYDGTVVGVANLSNVTLDGLIDGDELILSVDAAFADKNAGEGKSVALLTDYSGADAGNYSISNQLGSIAAITPRSLLVSGISADDKMFDSSVNADLDLSGVSYDGLVTGDQISLSASGRFSDANVDTGKVVFIAAQYSGADVANYAITTQPTTSASITAAAATPDAERIVQTVLPEIDNPTTETTKDGTNPTGGNTLLGGMPSGFIPGEPSENEILLGLDDGSGGTLIGGSTTIGGSTMPGGTGGGESTAQNNAAAQTSGTGSGTDSGVNVGQTGGIQAGGQAASGVGDSLLSGAYLDTNAPIQMASTADYFDFSNFVRAADRTPATGASEAGSATDRAGATNTGIGSGGLGDGAAIEGAADGSALPGATSGAVGRGENALPGNTGGTAEPIAESATEVTGQAATGSATAGAATAGSTTADSTTTGSATAGGETSPAGAADADEGRTETDTGSDVPASGGFAKVRDPESLEVGGGEYFRYTLEDDIFEHSDPNATLSFNARLANGDPLPAWLRFNPITQTFTGTAPRGLRAVSVEVSAKDRSGHQVSVYFTIKLADD